MKRALITGIAGQDGSYLAELLLNKDYEVHGIVRRSFLENKNNLKNIAGILDNITLHTSSLDNHLLVHKIISKIKPTECYHLAANSFVNHSLDDEVTTLSTSFNATYFLLSSIQEIVPSCRFYFAGSSEMFGTPETFPQNELTQFNPRSIYGIAKLACHHLVKNYRNRYGMYACTGISYNHESPRRGGAFVTKKIISGLSDIVSGKQKKITLGNLDAVRDWGYAPDYVEAMHKMLNNPHGPQDYVIATGISQSVRDFLEAAFSIYNLDYKNFVVIDEKLFRKDETVPLIGNATKIKNDLGWQPKTSLKKMIRQLIN
jgi:GDPmannose 4,6-dehydratase